MAKSRFTTPPMRMVQGDVDEAQTKDMQGNLRVVKSGPNAGQPNPQFFVAGAITKSEPTWPAFWELLVRQAHADFPNLFPHGVDAIIAAGGPQAWFTQPPQGHTMPWVMGDFSWKITDGDSSVVREGKLVNYAEREGWAGCWVVRFGSSYPPRVFDAGHYAAHEQIQQKGFIKRGYYIRVSGSTEGNANAQKPGLYLNLDMVERTAIYHEIVVGPDASQAFAAPAALPVGVTPTMGAPAPGAPPAPPAPPAAAPPPPPVAGPQRPTDPSFIHAAGTPGEQWYVNGAWIPAPVGNAAPPPPPAAPPAPPAAPASPAAASSAPGSPPPPPYAGFMQPGAGGPPAPPATPPSPPAPPPSAPPATPSLGNVMLPAANGSTYEQMIAAGWTDETLRAHGMMQ